MMKRMDIYARAKQFYNSKFAPERRNILQDLACISNDILEHERRLARENIAIRGAQTAGIGLFVAGIIAAPFTLGFSLALLGVGAAATTTSFATTAMHKQEKVRTIREVIFRAKQSLKAHDKTCLEMYELLQMLNEYQKSTGDQDERYFSLLRDANRPSRIVTFARNKEINAGKLFDEALKIRRVIDELESQDTKFHTFFNIQKFRYERKIKQSLQK